MNTVELIGAILDCIAPIFYDLNIIYWIIFLYTPFVLFGYLLIVLVMYIYKQTRK